MVIKAIYKKFKQVLTKFKPNSTQNRSCRCCHCINSQGEPSSGTRTVVQELSRPNLLSLASSDETRVEPPDYQPVTAAQAIALAYIQGFSTSYIFALRDPQDHRSL